MKRFVGASLNRRLNANPYTAIAALARRNPRAVLFGGGLGLASIVFVALIALSSVQAFLLISQQSANNSRNRISLSNNDDETAAATAGIVLVPAAPGAPQPLAAGQQPTAPVGRADVVAVYGLLVHTSIAANVRAMIDHAKADGVILSGWGWRDPKTQIRLRREHCGTSQYAIYNMPSSQCRPPTARPGRSQHERGLAIDFTYNGGSISTRRSPGFKWLDANAARYGFKNLASEPWHWSTTGR